VTAASAAQRKVFMGVLRSEKRIGQEERGRAHPPVFDCYGHCFRIALLKEPAWPMPARLSGPIWKTPARFSEPIWPTTFLFIILGA
jgi:hypothetical protein